MPEIAPETVGVPVGQTLSDEEVIAAIEAAMKTNDGDHRYPYGAAITWALLPPTAQQRADFAEFGLTPSPTPALRLHVVDAAAGWVRWEACWLYRRHVDVLEGLLIRVYGGAAVAALDAPVHAREDVPLTALDGTIGFYPWSGRPHSKASWRVPVRIEADATADEVPVLTMPRRPAGWP